MGVKLTGTADITVGTSATQLCGARSGRESIVLTHISGVDVFYGDAGVNPGNGAWVFKTSAGDEVQVSRDSFGEVGTSSAWFGRVASGSAVVHFGSVEQ